MPAAGQYSYDNYLTAVHITDKDAQYNFEFKDGSKTNQRADVKLNRKVIDNDGNQIKKIVKWYMPNEGGVSLGLRFFDKHG